MLTTTSLAAVTIFGIFVGALSLWGMGQPTKLIRFVRTIAPAFTPQYSRACCSAPP
jgi:hypothetical protein